MFYAFSISASPESTLLHLEKIYFWLCSNFVYVIKFQKNLMVKDLDTAWLLYNQERFQNSFKRIRVFDSIYTYLLLHSYLDVTENNLQQLTNRPKFGIESLHHFKENIQHGFMRLLSCLYRRLFCPKVIQLSSAESLIINPFSLKKHVFTLTVRNKKHSRLLKKRGFLQDSIA